MSQYNCPKCRCGCLFEEKNKLVCLNCGAEVPAFAARGVHHVHHYKTYTSGASEKPVTVRRPVPSGQNAAPRYTPGSRPAPTPNPVRLSSIRQIGTPRSVDVKKKRGCGFWILVYMGLFWLLPLLFGVLSDIF